MIILDTNFLVYIMKYKLAYQLEEHRKEIIIPDQVINELYSLSKKARIKDREAAKMALVLIEGWKIKKEETEGGADEAIKTLALKNKATVATMDKLLIKELKKSKIHILKIRQKRHLILD